MSRCKEHFWAELGGGYFRCSWCGDRKTKEELIMTKVYLPTEQDVMRHNIMLNKRVIELEAKLLRAETDRGQWVSDYAKQAVKLSYVEDAIKQVCSNYSVPEYERSVLKEALIKIHAR
jgi:hypothetical protein